MLLHCDGFPVVFHHRGEEPTSLWYFSDMQGWSVEGAGGVKPQECSGRFLAALDSWQQLLGPLKKVLTTSNLKLTHLFMFAYCAEPSSLSYLFVGWTEVIHSRPAGVYFETLIVFKIYWHSKAPKSSNFQLQTTFVTHLVEHKFLASSLKSHFISVTPLHASSYVNSFPRSNTHICNKGNPAHSV